MGSGLISNGGVDWDNSGCYDRRHRGQRRWPVPAKVDGGDVWLLNLLWVVKG